MQELKIKELLDGPVEMHGALDVDDRGNGISPRRLPAWTRPQVPKMMDVIVRMPSGVRLRFATDSTRVGLAFHATALQTLPAARMPTNFNLEIGGKLASAGSTLGNTLILERDKPGEFELERGSADEIQFSGLPAGKKNCELWLPHNALIELSELQLDEGASLERQTESTRPTWLHYGSSISHCMEAEEPALTWPAVAARAAGLDLHSLGLAGQCHLDPFVARTIRDAPADIVSLKVGINLINMDSMRERVFVPALHGFLDTVRERKPTTPIVLISPIYCPSAESNPGPTLPNAAGKFVTLPGDDRLREGCLTLQRVRKLIARVVEQRSSAGDNQLHYVDGLALFGEADAHDLPDDLHPNPAGYIRMGQRFAPRLQQIIGNQAS